VVLLGLVLLVVQQVPDKTKPPGPGTGERGVSALTRPVRVASAGALRKYYEEDRLHASEATPP